MRVTVWGINYAPEVAGIAPCNVRMCEGLRAMGNDVVMVTSFPYYPAWKKMPPDRGVFFRKDDLNNVPVYRCWHYVPNIVTPTKRILHEATFVGASFLRIMSLPSPDVYVVVSPPLLLGLAAWLASLLKGAPFVFHVQDLQPDAAVSLGMLKPNFFTRLLYGMEALAYKKARFVCGISRGMVDCFRRKGVPPEKLVYFPNSAEAVDHDTLPARGAFRQKHEIASGDFLAVYSGNLGVKQGIEILLEAAKYITAENIKIIICGQGAHRGVLEAGIRMNTLERRILLLPLQASQDYTELLVDSDVCLITQQRGAGGAFFPSKLLSALAFYKPVVTVADEESELFRALTEGEFGLNVLPGQPEQLAQVLSKLASSPDLLKKFSLAAQVFVQQFDKGKILREFGTVLREAVGEEKTLLK